MRGNGWGFLLLFFLALSIKESVCEPLKNDLPEQKQDAPSPAVGKVITRKAVAAEENPIKRFVVAIIQAAYLNQWKISPVNAPSQEGSEKREGDSAKQKEKSLQKLN